MRKEITVYEFYLSTTNGIVKDDYRENPSAAFDRCFSLLKHAGYDRVDVSFWDVSTPDSWFDRDGWERTVEEIGLLCEKHKLPVHQTHGNTYVGKQWDDPTYPYHELQHRTTLRSVTATAMLGGSVTVLHPMNLPADKLYDQKKAKDAAIRYLSPYIEEAKRVGICIAVENMVDFGGFRRRYCGGDVWELIDLVDTINDPSVGICLDTGHANISHVDTAEAIRAMGGRLKALHINDNLANGKDDHLFPYFGSVDWAETVKALKEIGYRGDFAYEAGSQRIPPALYAPWLAYTAALGRHLMSL